RERAGEAGAAPVELREEGGEEHAERVLGAVGEQQDDEGAADDDPAVVEARAQRSGARAGGGAGDAAGAGAGDAAAAVPPGWLDFTESSMAGDSPAVGRASTLMRRLSRPTASRIRPPASTICTCHFASRLSAGHRPPRRWGDT